MALNVELCSLSNKLHCECIQSYATLAIRLITDDASTSVAKYSSSVIKVSWHAHSKGFKIG